MIDEKDGGVKQGKAGANLGEETTNPQNPDLGMQLGQPREPFGFARKFHAVRLKNQDEQSKGVVLNK